MADNEARGLGFEGSVPVDQRKNGLQGILFQYYSVDRDVVITERLKPDYTFTFGGKPRKYLQLKGSSNEVYLPHTTTKEDITKKKRPLVITEGEFKTLALAEAVGQTFAVVGIPGVNGGWFRKKKVEDQPNGTVKKVSYGQASLVPGLAMMNLHGRKVYIVFDSDVGSVKQASIYKSTRGGAIAAEKMLAKLLRARGADVRIVEVPSLIEGGKTGIDDYIVLSGKNNLMRLIIQRWVPERDIAKILTESERGPQLEFTSIHDMAAKSSTDKPSFIIDELLPVGGVSVIAAAPKVGKSSIAFNAAASVAKGDKFLGRFICTKGRAAYIQTEIPEWAMLERVKLMGDLSSIPAGGILVMNPHRMHLNLWREEGIARKHAETGNRVAVADLIKTLREKKVTLAIFDPMVHFHTLNENSVEHMTHFFEVVRGIAEMVPCGVILVHHNRKTARDQTTYHGAEDMRGSISTFAEVDSVLSMYQVQFKDGSQKFKLVCSTRHAEQPEDMELIRYGGNMAMLWYAEPWEKRESTIVPPPNFGGGE